MGSEIQRLRKRIEEEHQACVYALSELALGCARHDFINARIERMGEAHECLKELIGEEAAAAFLCEVFDRSPEQRAQPDAVDEHAQPGSAL